MKRTDLHIHSTYSDGGLTPEEIIVFAKKAGISAVSITDHDTVSGQKEAIGFGKKHDVEVISGVEFSAIEDNIPLHILGYGMKINTPSLQEFINDRQKERSQRNEEIIAKLQNLGISISIKEVEQFATNQIGRPHIAKFIVYKRKVSSFDEAFARYLRKGAKAYVDINKPHATEVLDIIIKAGGVPVLAHPGIISASATTVANLIKKLLQSGLSGIEVYHSKHSRKVISLFEPLAKELGLIVTGGSDFHGISNDTFSSHLKEINAIKVPYSIFKNLRTTLDSST